MTLICTWLTEIYLDKLNLLKDSSSSKDQYQVLKEEFEGFLKDYKDHLDKNTTFQLISSNGRISELLFYASVIEDWETVIRSVFCFLVGFFIIIFSLSANLTLLHTRHHI